MKPRVFERLIHTDIPEQMGVLGIIGPPGVGKTLLCHNSAADYLQRNMRTIVVTLDVPPPEVRRRLNQLGMKTEEERLLILDGYSWAEGVKPTERYALSGIGNLSDISILISQLLEKAGPNSFLIFDSVSTLLTYSDEASVLKFLQTVSSRLRRNRTTADLIFTYGIHSDSFYNALRASLDGVVELKLDEVGGSLHRFMRVYSFKGGDHDTRWYPFKINQDSTITVGAVPLEDFRELLSRLTINEAGVMGLLGGRVVLLPTDYISKIYRVGVEMGIPIDECFYEAGRRVGRRFGEFFEIHQKTHDRQLLETICRNLTLRGVGEFRIVEFSINPLRVRVELYSSYLASDLAELGRNVDEVYAGGLAGVMEHITKGKVTVKETRCAAKGDPYCEFTAVETAPPEIGLEMGKR